jgi:glycine cleavage system transcriptional repressor
MQEKESLILTAVGRDQIGLVEKISEFIVARDCNIEDSKMAVFCGEFALIILITGASENLTRIGSSYNELGKMTGLTIWTKRPSSKMPSPQSLPYRLSASCMDHPGVVHRLSALLSEMSINIESMETKTYSAPVSGTPIFRMEATLTVPANLNINNLRARFSAVEREENIDIDLSLME